MEENCAITALLNQTIAHECCPSTCIIRLRGLDSLSPVRDPSIREIYENGWKWKSVLLHALFDCMFMKRAFIVCWAQL